MATQNFEQLENSLKTLGRRANLSYAKKQIIRDRVFQAVGQIQLADAIAEGKQKADLSVSLKHLKDALMPQKLSFSMPVTMMVAGLVLIVSVMTSAMAQGSNPSDALFPVKKVLEKIELAFVFNPVDKAKATMDIANDRLKSLGQVQGQDKDLEKVLRESQVAVVSAKDALNKAKVGKSDADVSALLNQFNNLLEDQKTILKDIETKSGNDNVKNAVVAVREALGDKTSDKATDSNKESANTTTKTNTVVLPVTPENPILNGRQTVIGRISTNYGNMAIVVKGKFYNITSMPLDLSQYIGTDNVIITGDFSNGQVNIIQIVINGSVFGAQILPKN